MRDDPPGINRHERAEAWPTCDFAWMGEDGPIYCLAPALIAIRYRWIGRAQGPSGGVMCAQHWMLAAEQLAADPDIEYDSIEVCRIDDEVE